jgi:uncharacterized protein
MFNIGALAGVTLLAIAASVLPGRAQDAGAGIATEVASDLVDHRFVAVFAHFTPELAKALPEAALEKAWTGLLQQGGAVREIAAIRQAQAMPDGGSLLIIPIRLERMTVDLKVMVANGKVAGLLITPAATAPTQAWSPPAYVGSETFTTLDVAVGPTSLGGTLSLPKADGRVPAVVLIHGSGPGDRDESIGPNRPFRDLAEGLATRGVAALRYDKRPRVHPEQFIGTTFTVREETMDDVLAAVALLAARPDIDAGRIFIIGHSLGGMLAPRIAEAGHGIAGIVILAGATRPLPLILLEQVEYLATLDGSPDDATRKRVDAVKLEVARAMAAKPDEAGPNILNAPPAYWADLNAYDSAATAARLSLPMLILQGGRDYQVTGADLARFKTALAGHDDVTIREFPGLNHFFMAGAGKSRPDEYERAGHVDAAVVDTIARFVAGARK